ncbi:hypothetical protein L6164_028186 [Bauhinia variegata]|uniref:Uncharacterized protein n=1 Tax=Bauhinia variegata TaxID=167791 RepID=A0ACB9LV71_BAUVA|nr:hypothetical protein L6164_028186 [Bauhinia variegata]
MSRAYSEVGFLVFAPADSDSAMTELLNVSAANMGLNISQDFSHEFEGVCFYLSLHKQKSEHFRMTLH